MTNDLFGNLEAEIVDRVEIRQIVRDKVSKVKKLYRNIPDHIHEFNKELGHKLKIQWLEEENAHKLKVKRETAIIKLTRLQEKAKTYRNLAISALTEKWYDLLRDQRSELALVTAMYEFSEIENILTHKDKVNKPIQDELNSLKPIILRLKKPQKPKTGNILLTSVKYNFETEFMNSITPLFKIFKLIKLEKSFKYFSSKLAKSLQKEWNEENKKFIKINNKETVEQRIRRFKVMITKYHLIGLHKISKRWYSKSKSVLKKYPEFKFIEELNEISNIIEDNKLSSKIKKINIKAVPIKSMKKPRGISFKSKDIKYDIEVAFNSMIRPFEECAYTVKKKIDKLIMPSKKLKIKTKIKRYQDTLIAREYLTLICQAVAPRPSNGKELK